MLVAHPQVGFHKTTLSDERSHYGGVVVMTFAHARRLSAIAAKSQLTDLGFVDQTLTLSTDYKYGSSKIGKHLQVFVRENNVDQALRILKRKMQREGVFREMKRRKAYEKPSERKNREKAEAIRRARKAARKQAQREGLIPSPKRREDGRRPVVRPPAF